MTQSLSPMASNSTPPVEAATITSRDEDIARTVGVLTGSVLGFVDRRPYGGELTAIPTPSAVGMDVRSLRRVEDALTSALRSPGDRTSERLLVRELPEFGARIGGLLPLDNPEHSSSCCGLDLAVDLTRACLSAGSVGGQRPSVESDLERLSGCWRQIGVDGLVERHGDAWDRLLGALPGSLVGRPALELLDGVSARCFSELVLPVLEQRGEVQDFPLLIKRPHGDSVECRYSAVVRRDESDRVMGRTEVFVPDMARSKIAESTALARYAASSANVTEFATFCLNRLRSDYGFELAMFVPVDGGASTGVLSAGSAPGQALVPLAQRWLRRLIEVGAGEYVPDTSVDGTGSVGRQLARFGIATAYAVPVRRPGTKSESIGLLMVASRVPVCLQDQNRTWIDGVAGLIGLVEQRDQAFVLQRSEARIATTTLSAVSECVLRVSADGRIEFANPAAERLTGLSVEQLIGRELDQVLELHAAEDERRVVDPLTVPDADCESSRGHRVFLCVDASGGIADVELSVKAIRSANGTRLGSVLTLRDITHSQELSRELEHRAAHDPLTGLANRSEFDLQAREFVQSAAESDSEGVVCVVDLDRFKPVNDTCGHLAGDELLKQISRHLLQCVGSDDLVARIGGDEFGLLLRNCGVERGRRVAADVCRRFAEFRFRWDDRVFSVGASIGVASTSGSLDAATVVRRADEACYGAKRKGRNRVEIEDDSDPVMARERSEWGWASRIQSALDEDRFQLVAQPIHVTQRADARIAGAEILLRLVNEDGSLSTPGEFLPAAERYGLMQSIDRWVIDQVFDVVDSDPSVMDEVGFLAINLSGSSLADEAVRARVFDRLDRSKLEPSKFGFEVTETAAISNLERATAFLGDLRGRGCPVLLDDFGSGFSSFGYLRDLPASIVKFDGRFVVGMTKDPGDAAVIRAVHQIATAYGLETVAEHVEDEETRSALAEIGVNFVQGFGIAMPVELTKFLEQVRSVQR